MTDWKGYGEVVDNSSAPSGRQLSTG